MTNPVSVQSVIAAIRERRPDQGGSRLRALLFFTQGHYIAHNGGRPLFTESLYASFDGVTIDLAGRDGLQEQMDNRQLGFIGYALDRYADMRDADLQSLVRTSSAWQLAQQTSDGRIEQEWMTDWFNRAAERRTRPSLVETAFATALFRPHAA